MKFMQYIFISLVLIMMGCAQPEPLMIESIKATVVDDTSGEPLEDVRVIFIASAYEETSNGRRKENLIVTEGKTDAMGVIEFPPQEIENPRPYGSNTLYHMPRIMFSKTGYLSAYGTQPFKEKIEIENVQRWANNGETIRLKKKSSLK